MRGGWVFNASRFDRATTALRPALMQGVCLKGVLVVVMVLGTASAAQAERDPTRPPSSHVVLPSIRGAAAVEEVSTFRLTSVVLGTQRRLATINGKTLAVGQWVDGARVHRIDARQVLLHWQGQQQTLTLSRRAVTKIKREAK